MKKIETRDNEFVIHFREVLKTHFPSIFRYRVQYMLGEDREGRRGLYFELKSELIGEIYSRFEELGSHETPFDHEEEFINNVINDLVLSGITLMNIEAHEKNRNEKVAKEIKIAGFRNIMPKIPIFTN